MQGKVIVVGGGLAGLCAAHTILERGGRVLLLDKNSFLGGNSTKATSGINGALTKTQVRLGIQDSVEKFLEDTAQSASRGKKSDPTDLQRVLVGNSAAGVEWLGSRFGLDLSLVSRLGGHSFPRTHRGKEKFPGMTITYALMEKFEDISKENPKIAQLRVSCRVTRLLTDSTGAVVGCEYENQGKLYQEQGPVVLATGGFGADFTDDGLLKKLRPELMPLPTTNGDHCTGDGMKMGDAIGASLVDMEQVQVHPTGLVHPDDPNAKVKFLAAEALRGVGGFLLDKDGNRFCDELGRRDYVTGEMWKRAKGPYRLILNSAAGKEIEWHVKHYQGRGLMKYYESGQALAKDMGISYDKLKQSCDKYSKGASDKKDEFGKKFFHNMPVRADDSFWVAIVTPVIHYCMGGLQINAEANCVTKQGKLIPGLFACGEVTGGIHGDNRLGGSSLQDCVVYGRVAGDTAARYLMQTTLDRVTSGGAERRLNTVAGQIGIGTTKSDTLIGATITQPGVQTRVEVEPISQRMALEVKWDQYGNVVSASGAGVAAPVPVSVAPSTAAVPSAAPATQASTSVPSAAPAAPAKLKEYTLADVAQHKTEKDCWVVVNGQVLDVTTFLKDHPGGKQAILLYAGKDATAEFNMLHKPDVVQRYAPHTVIGTLASGGASGGHAAPSSPKSSSKPTESKKEAAKGAPSKALKSAVAKSAELASQSPKASTDSGAAGSVTKDWTKPNNTMSLTPLPKAIPSNQQSPISGGTADILPAERKKATFEVEKLTNVLDGGPERTARRRFIISPSEGTEVTDRYYMDRHELMKTHLKHFIHVHEKFMGKFVPTREEVSWMSEFAMLSGTMMNHWGLFLPTILGQANDDQVSEWLPAAFTMRIVGCYGQTELGHGSNVRGLQTTATYDKKTQEFIINTPTLQSLKWWPGTLGKVCTHALVYAQLILDGREYGVHIFMVQIRDENHRPLPGIELGDVGPKLGDGANDTGFMRITNVRVPRERMLAKYQQVATDGTYIKAEEKTNDKMHYATMMFVRGSMVKMAGGFLARAVTIATRYACVRKQGFVNTAKDVSFRSQENAIIEYQVQRYRIFRQLALAYAMKFTGKWMIDRFKDLEGAGAGVIVDTAALPEIAATSAGLKAFCTFLTSQGIEDCRKCCGGNGYLLSSGIGALSQDYVWQTTAEGDFIVLMLQTARFLMKSVRDARAKKPVAGFVEYLAPLADPKFNPAKAAPAEAKTVKDFLNLDYLTSLFKYRAMMAVVAAGEELARKQQSGLSFDEAWNTVAVQLCDATKAHCYAFMVNTFVQAVRQAKEDKDVQTVLGRICALFALSNIQDDQWAGFGVIHVDQMRLVRAAVAQLLDELRPDAVPMVDAFDIPDRVLNSTIGMYDGNVYEALYEAAKKSQLNQVDPFDGYQDVLRPRLDLDILKQGNSKL